MEGRLLEQGGAREGEKFRPFFRPNLTNELEKEANIATESRGSHDVEDRALIEVNGISRRSHEGKRQQRDMISQKMGHDDKENTFIFKGADVGSSLTYARHFVLRQAGLEKGRNGTNLINKGIPTNLKEPPYDLDGGLHLANL
ncbi:hypothetical protein LIER_31192 [Lithospermum erythrorhizon]|uniref:Uncharacterized protein n=1 Tax=Lithospermum erythrorhizon TaxID=34254 RepID=A0AAV3RQ44_LITER